MTPETLAPTEPITGLAIKTISFVAVFEAGLVDSSTTDSQMIQLMDKSSGNIASLSIRSPYHNENTGNGWMQSSPGGH